MASEVVKRPGANWDIYYMHLDGERDCMSVFGSKRSLDERSEIWGRLFRIALRSMRATDQNTRTASRSMSGR